MIKKVSYLVLSLILILHSTSYAWWWSRPEKEARESGSGKEAFIESANIQKVLRIGLVDCIAYSLNNNSEIKIERLEPKIKKQDIKIAEEDFEPTLNVDFEISDNEEPVNNTLLSGGTSTSLTKNVGLNTSIDGRLVTGTEYSLEFLSKRYKTNSRFQTINPSYEVEPKITVTQPIFGDYGIFVSRADIVIARNDKKISEEDLRNLIMDTLTRAKTDYYNYFYYGEHYSIAKSSLERAKELLDINKERYAKGLISSVDLLETETAVATREKALIAAEADFKSAEDELKLITNLVDDPEMWNAELELIDRPEIKISEVNLENSLQNAFEHRPDYKSAKIDLENRDVKVKVAKNNALPTVDLKGSFGLNGLEKGYRSAIDDISGDYKDWSVGMEVSLPWGEGDRAEYKKEKMEKAQALIAFKRMEQNIILEVRDKVREVDIQYRQVKAAELSQKKETENYKAQKERYASGQISTHDILDYQDRLSLAEIDYSKALIDYNIAVNNLDQAEGLTLEKNDIILEE
ncbi:MAG: TolC family protein [Candidatus Omnitrophica bacterium]|nr:TolC family protein [Candidatus Omnitrophota bacterium]